VTFRIVSAALALLFAFGAVVQWNDPDPLRWMAAYLAVCGLSVAAVMGRYVPVATAVVLGVLLVWIVMWSPAFPATSLSAMQSLGMSGLEEEEEVREVWGLSLLATWTAVLLGKSLFARPEAGHDVESHEDSSAQSPQ
jgi:lysylphosphatidylglycerol synthetase-like protein (DUF2156 family)